MKLNDALRFPHPVLDAEPGGDYVEGAIKAELEVKEDPHAGIVHFTGTVTVTHTGFRNLLESGSIRCVLAIVCLDTYLIHHHPIGSDSFSLTFDGGRLRGPVSARPVLQVVGEEVQLPGNGLNPEFQLDGLKLRRGDVVGIGEEFRFEAGLDKLVPLESVFKLVKSPDLDEPRFELVTDKQTVEIAVSPVLYDQISAMRNATGARDILLSSLYLPCVIELLAVAHSDPQPNLRWFQAFETRCRQLGIELDGRDLATNAQKLLKDPLGDLYKAVEGLH